MENIIIKIQDFFKKTDWKYESQDKKKSAGRLFKFGIDMNGIVGTLRMYINISEKDYIVIGVLNNKVEKEYYAAVSEYLHRANFGLKNGNFEMDYDDGEIRYKTYVNFVESEISEDVIKDSIFMVVAMFDKYGQGLMQTMSTGVVADVK